MHLLVRTQERFSGGDTVDADEWRQEPTEVPDYPSVSGVAFGMVERELVWYKGVNGGRGKGPNIASSAITVVM